VNDDRFETLLRREIGLDVASIGSASIERAVRERMTALANTGVLPACKEASLADASASRPQRDAYWLELSHSNEERQRLIEAVIVPETWFFRDREAFAALAKLASERHARWPGRRLRLLSVPCSSGEEPYSIAMALLDAGLSADAFSIDAIDVSERNIALARRAFYGRNAFRGHLLDFRERHFSAAGDGWQLGDPVREAVRFVRMNLFDAALAANPRYDFVFCRNLLIYFDREDQARAVDVLERLLTSDGTLFVGPSETGALFRHAMRSAKIPLAFAFHKTPAEVPPAVTAPRRSAEPVRPRTDTQQARAAASLAQSITHSFVSPRESGTNRHPAVGEMRANGLQMSVPRPDLSSRSAGVPFSQTGLPSFQAGTPSPQVAAPFAQQPAAARRALEFEAALTLANRGQLREATVAADLHLDTYGPSAEVFYLLGLIADADGRPADASICYRKTLYLDPRHYEALTHLATLLALQGDHTGAHLLSERAVRVSPARIPSAR
jgi:chemotaxis protein methyltransferase WspC